MITVLFQLDIDSNDDYCYYTHSVIDYHCHIPVISIYATTTLSTIGSDCFYVDNGYLQICAWIISILITIINSIFINTSSPILSTLLIIMYFSSLLSFAWIIHHRQLIEQICKVHRKQTYLVNIAFIPITSQLYVLFSRYSLNHIIVFSHSFIKC